MASKVPSSGDLYMGYNSGEWKSYYDFKLLYPRKVVKSIAIAATIPADILDVETGDATPEEAPGWLANGMGHTIYCGGYVATDVIRLVDNAGIANWNLIVAVYDGNPALPNLPHIVGKQYASYPDYDVSTVTEEWAAIPAVKLPKVEDMALVVIRRQSDGAEMISVDGSVYPLRSVADGTSALAIGAVVWNVSDQEYRDIASKAGLAV